MKSILNCIFISVALLAAPTALAETSGADPASTDGMELITEDKRGSIYADPDVDWSVYQRIILDDATVAFRKNWRRDQNRGDPLRITPQDMEDIKQGLSELFSEVFTEEFSTNGGYEIVEAAGDNILRIKPRIVDLDVYAPDTGRFTGMSRSYTESSGRMTLKLEIHDSVTGDLIAVASDKQESPYRGYFQWTTGSSNRADARRMLQKSAEGFRTRLDEATAKTPAE